MAKKKKFLLELDRLYKRRTRWLRSVIGDKRPGPRPKFNRETVNRSIVRLQDIASKIFAKKLAKDEFADFAPAKRAWQVKGRGYRQKRALFDEWFERRLGTTDKCVYAFWGKSGQCIYVGRTGKGGSRPRSHFNKVWIPSVKRIDVYSVRLASQLPKLECLAIHLFLPRENDSKAATEKWTKKCPMCEMHKDIHDQLRGIYRLK